MQYVKKSIHNQTKPHELTKLIQRTLNNVTCVCCYSRQRILVISLGGNAIITAKLNLWYVQYRTPQMFKKMQMLNHSRLKKYSELILYM